MTIKIFIKSFCFIFVLPLIFSCHQNLEQHSATDKTNEKIIPPEVILLANLPDSSKPDVTLMEEVPKPQTSVINTPPTVHSFIDAVTQEPVAPEAQGIGMFKNFTTDQGLALDAVNCSIMDKAGNLWFGTQGGGISRYDGKKFTNYNSAQGLAENSVFCVAEDEKGNLWCGSYGGVSRYDGKSFINYSTAQGLAHNNVYSIKKDKTGNLWFGTQGGVSRYDGKSFTNFTTKEGLPNNEIYCIAEDKLGHLWFGTFKGGVSCYDGKSFINYSIKEGLANDNVSCIVEDKKGKLWFGTQGGGVSKYDGKSFANYTTKHGLADNNIFGITEDKKGNLWFGTQKGVSRYDGEKFTNFTTAQGLVNNGVHCVQEDKKGNLWFGTFGGGVSCYEGNSVINYTTEQGLADNLVWRIIKDKKGNLWFGTNRGGASRYNGESFTNYTTAQGLPNNEITCIVEDKKKYLWFGTDGGGVSRYDGKSFTNYTTAKWLPDNDISSILQDKKGNLWICTFSSGVSCYDGKFVTHYTSLQGLASNIVRCIIEDRKGNLWFGTEGGASCFDGKSFINYSIAQGLANNRVFCIQEDKEGNLWFGTTGAGVSRFDGKSFCSYSVAQGLPHNLVTTIIADSQSNIIFGTNLGLGVMVSFKLKSTENKKVNQIPAQNNLSNEELKKYTPQIEIYNSSTGYTIKDISSMFKDSAGIVWIGTGSDKSGLVRFDYSAIKKSTKPPLVTLQAVKLNNELICWNDLLSDSGSEVSKTVGDATSPNISEEVTTIGKVLTNTERDDMRRKFGNIKFDSISNWYPIPQNLVLSYNHNSISFEFSAIETGKNFLVKYQYMLEGYDDDWSLASNETSASFGNMYEGNYTFKLKAQSPDGVWSEPLLYTFTVLPPWYRTWWAYFLYGIFFIAVLWRFVRWRLSVLKKEKARLDEKIAMQNAIMDERSRISRELHDEVGATLSGIAMYSHLAKEQVKSLGIPGVGNSLNIMQQSAGEMVNKLNDIVWLINPEQDSLQKLIQRLEEYARDMAAIKNITVKVMVPDHLHEHILPVESRRNIYLFCKEAINNAVKYSNGTLLELTIKETGGKLEFSVSDNGKGFNPETIKRGNGLDNMQKRADEIGAKMIVESKQDEGSMLAMQLKIT